MGAWKGVTVSWGSHIINIGNEKQGRVSLRCTAYELSYCHVEHTWSNIIEPTRPRWIIFGQPCSWGRVPVSSWWHLLMEKPLQHFLISWGLLANPIVELGPKCGLQEGPQYNCSMLWCFGPETAGMYYSLKPKDLSLITQLAWFLSISLERRKRTEYL